MQHPNPVLGFSRYLFLLTPHAVVSAANAICCFNACRVVCQNVHTFLVVVYTVFAQSGATLD